MKIVQIHYSASNHKQKLRLADETTESLEITELGCSMIKIILTFFKRILQKTSFYKTFLILSVLFNLMKITLNMQKVSNEHPYSPKGINKNNLHILSKQPDSTTELSH
jgi:hypothetical protein